MNLNLKVFSLKRKNNSVCFKVNENNEIQTSNVNNQSKGQFTITKFSKNDESKEMQETMIETQEIITVSTDKDGKLIEIIESNEDTVMIEDSEDVDLEDQQQQTNIGFKEVIFKLITLPCKKNNTFRLIGNFLLF